MLFRMYCIKYRLCLILFAVYQEVWHELLVGNDEGNDLDGFGEIDTDAAAQDAKEVEEGGEYAEEQERADVALREFPCCLE